MSEKAVTKPPRKMSSKSRRVLKELTSKHRMAAAYCAANPSSQSPEVAARFGWSLSHYQQVVKQDLRFKAYKELIRTRIVDQMIEDAVSSPARLPVKDLVEPATRVLKDILDSKDVHVSDKLSAIDKILKFGLGVQAKEGPGQDSKNPVVNITISSAHERQLKSIMSESQDAESRAVTPALQK